MKWTIIIAGLFFLACKKESKPILNEYPDDITFESLNVGRFTHQIPGSAFSVGDSKSGQISVNSKKDGVSFKGFAISSRNYVSYPFSLSTDFVPANALTTEKKQQAIDSTIFSVYTARPNRTGNYLVGNAVDNEAYITLDKPSVIEHILVANNTYNWLLETYGSIYSGTLLAPTQSYSLTGTKVRNNLNPNTSNTMYGRFFLPGPGDKEVIRLAGAQILGKIKAGKAAADLARLNGKTPAQATADSTTAYNAYVEGFVKLTVTGYNGATVTGTVDYWLAILTKVDAANPTWNIIRNDWGAVDLTPLGSVTKILFNVTTSYKDNSGTPLVAPYFCLDGIRIKK